MAPAQLGGFLLVHRRNGAVRPVLFLEQPSRASGSVEEQHARGFRTAVLPGVRDAARHEGTGAGAADRCLVADPERDLAGELDL